MHAAVSWQHFVLSEPEWAMMIAINQRAYLCTWGFDARSHVTERESERWRRGISKHLSLSLGQATCSASTQPMRLEYSWQPKLAWGYWEHCMSEYVCLWASKAVSASEHSSLFCRVAARQVHSKCSAERDHEGWWRGERTIRCVYWAIYLFANIS